MFTIPKIEPASKKSGAIQYPVVSTWDVVKEYIHVAKNYWPSGLLTIFGWVLATVFFSIIAPLFYKEFFDTLTQATVPSEVLPQLVRIIFVIAVVNIIGWVGYRLASFADAYFVSHVVKKLAQDSFDYLMYHSHTFFISNFSGALTQRVNRFSRSFLRFFDQIAENILPLSIKIVGTVVVLSSVSSTLSILILIWIVVFMIGSYIFALLKLKYDIYSAQLDSKMVATLSDSVVNHGTVQLFNGYKNESSLFKKATEDLTSLSIFRWNLNSIAAAFQSGIGILIEFTVFYVGIKYWSEGTITIGTFVLVQAYIIAISTSLWSFGSVVRNLYEAIADGREMTEILHLKYEITDASHAKALEVRDGRIEFKNVSFKFGKEASLGKSVFGGISIDIKPGEKVAVIGPSGAGKSTLVKLLLRLHDIQEGQILVDGQNIKEVTQESLRNNISLVPQDPALFHRTLMENIRYGRRDATDEEVIAAAKLAHCDVFINELPYQYQTFVGERGVKLSGGERQRVAIARAILKNAPILILDEATSSLDSHSEVLIQDALHTLMKGKTTIVIAHRLSTIRNMDRIIVVSKGGVVEEGSHNELIKKADGVYAKLWKLQAGGFGDKSIEELLEV